MAVAIVRECLDALRALHQQGIVHADVKPSNIMLKLTGNTKLIDLGAAFEMSDAAPPDTVTPRYAAPELFGATLRLHNPTLRVSDTCSLRCFRRSRLCRVVQLQGAPACEGTHFGSPV